MRIISRSRLLSFAKSHGDVAAALDTWYRVAKKAQWTSLTDVRKTFNAADQVGNFTVFNIKGNQYRLIVDIQYQTQKIYIKSVLSHSEYDKNDWKRDPYY